MSTFENNGLRLHYQLLGQASAGGTGPLVVFLHGLVMDNLSSWYFTLANPVSLLAPTLVYDLRGHGMSDRPKTGYRVEDHVADLEELVRSVGEDRPLILVGNSFGGLLALNFALKHPTRVRSLVLIDAQLNDQAWKSEMNASLGLQGEARDRMIESTFKNWLGRNSKRKSNRLAQKAHELVNESSLLEDLQSSCEITDEDLKTLTMPVLAIYGEGSDILHVARQLERHAKNVTLHVLEGCTHSLLWEQTDQVKGLVLNWINTINERNDVAPKKALSFCGAPAHGAH